MTNGISFSVTANADSPYYMFPLPFSFEFWPTQIQVKNLAEQRMLILFILGLSCDFEESSLCDDFHSEECWFYLLAFTHCVFTDERVKDQIAEFHTN